MRTRLTIGILLLVGGSSLASAGERAIVTLKDMQDTEVRSQGITVPQRLTVHIKALGGGGDYGWSYKSDRMFAYGWIINAETRQPVWKMTTDNTSRSGSDRSFDGTITLEPGSYEVYFAAYAFGYHTTFTHFNVNIDHRSKPLFHDGTQKEKGFFSWLSDFWSDDIKKDWQKRAPQWGMDLLVDESVASTVSTFAPPKETSDVVVKMTGAGERELLRKGFSVGGTTTLQVYALGEDGREGELVDFGWIVSVPDRERVWEMTERNTSPAGGAKKNVVFNSAVELAKGEYVLYYVTDGSHSAADWNEEPPYDPLNWGVTVRIDDEKERKNFKSYEYDEDKNVIVALTKVRDNEYRSEGFTLKEPMKVRVYALGERNNNRRSMADYGLILDAKSRSKVWTMDVDRTEYAGGAAKNRYIDEVVMLPKGSYLVSYTADDSHAYDEWNDDPPFDPDHYGISVMGVGEKFNASMVTRYEEGRDKNIIAQIVRAGDDVNRAERFSLPKTTRVRVYAIGEGRDREMYDYGWIENARTGNVVWEMTYNMSFYAGGGRKNRMVNTTILLEKGDYVLHWKSDDSHSYGDWNVEPPEDPQYWGITLFRDEGAASPPIPPVPGVPPKAPTTGDAEEE
jgi:hypothetical protein